MFVDTASLWGKPRLEGWRWQNAAGQGTRAWRWRSPRGHSDPAVTW